MSNIYAPNGSSWGVTYTWVQGDTVNDSVTITSPIITAQLYTFWFTVKQAYPMLDSQAVFQATWTAMGGAGALSTAIQATKTQTGNIPAGSAYVFDWVMIDASGNDTTIMTSAGQQNNSGMPGNAGAMIILPRSTANH